MNKSILAAVMLAATLAMLALGLAPATMSAQDKAPARTKWEYKIVRASAATGHLTSGTTGLGAKTVLMPGVISDAALTALGADGWELDKITGGQPFVVSHRTITPPPTAGITGPITENAINFTETVYYFKRGK